MTVIEEFRIAVAASAVGSASPELLPERLARACVRALPVDGAGISLFFAGDRRLPVGGSDPAAGVAERLQFTTGEGPCLSAHAEGRPVVADEATIRSRWPAFYEALVARTPIRGTISLPLTDQLRGIGALDLYTIPPNGVRSLSLADALEIGTEVTATFRASSRAGRQRGDGPEWLDAPAAQRRSRVWQAMGFVNSALDVSSTDALAILRACAYADGKDLDELAEQVLDNQVPLDRLVVERDSST